MKKSLIERFCRSLGFGDFSLAGRRKRTNSARVSQSDGVRYKEGSAIFALVSRPQSHWHGTMFDTGIVLAHHYIEDRGEIGQLVEEKESE